MKIVGETIWQRFKGGKAGSLWYYRALVETFKQVENRPIVEELERVVLALENLTAAESSLSI